MELAAQLCSLGVRLLRLQDILPVLPYLNLAPEEIVVLMKVCQAHEDDPTARFLQLYEAALLHHERVCSPKQFYEAANTYDAIQFHDGTPDDVPLEVEVDAPPGFEVDPFPLDLDVEVEQPRVEEVQCQAAADDAE